MLASISPDVCRELIGLLTGVVIYEALCFDVAQDRMNVHPTILKLTGIDLLVKLANYYTTRGAPPWIRVEQINSIR